MSTWCAIILHKHKRIMHRFLLTVDLPEPKNPVMTETLTFFDWLFSSSVSSSSTIMSSSESSAPSAPSIMGISSSVTVIVMC